MKKFLSAFSLFLFCFAFCQNYYQNFLELEKNNDSIKIKKLLTDWEKNKPNDPELYVAAVNFYYSQSKNEVLSLSKNQQSSDALAIKNDKGQVEAFLGADASFNDHFIKKTMRYFDLAIAKFPDRLDVRFGKIYILGQIKDYQNFTSELLKTINHSNEIKNQWLWAENQKYQGGEDTFLGNIQEYINNLFDANDDALLLNMRQVSEEVMKFYPNRVEFPTNIGVTYLIENNPNKALEYFLVAEKIDNKDYIVLNNIARCYEINEDKNNAVKYYELALKYCEQDAKKEIEHRLEQLKNN